MTLIFKLSGFHAVFAVLLLMQVKGNHKMKCHVGKGLSNQQTPLKTCKKAPHNGQFNFCYVSRDILKTGDVEERECVSVWYPTESRCSSFGCYCDTDGCNKDFQTCLASFNRTDDPYCQREEKAIPDTTCYDEKWLFQRESQLIKCEPEEDWRKVCKIRAQYSEGMRKECDSMRTWNKVYCNREECICDEDGCNKDWKTCLASINRTDDPECQIETGLHPELRCYHDKWLSFKQGELKKCENRVKGMRNACRVATRYSPVDGEYGQKGCEEVEDDFEGYCYVTDGCYCDTDGCNKDWLTCLASINKTDDPDCQLRLYPAKKCYHNNELKMCEQASKTRRSICSISRYHGNACYDWSDEYGLLCNKWDCFCDEDGCNKDWNTCLASLNKTDDPNCQYEMKN